jgi:hypothetical protein
MEEVDPLITVNRTVNQEKQADVILPNPVSKGIKRFCEHASLEFGWD